MHYLHTTLAVTDLEAARTFLETWAGLATVQQFDLGPARFAFLSGGMGETEVELIQSPDQPVPCYAGLSLGFAVTDLDGERERALAAGLEPSPIRQPQPGTRFFFLTGPDGLTVQLMQKG